MARSVNRRFVRWLEGELPDLVSEGVISSANADAIRRHYEAEESRSTNLGFLILATIGSALIAGGIILLIAHNWDELSRPIRCALALLPLLLAQALGAFVLLRRPDSAPWRESVAILIVASVAAAIALVSQTFQIQGSLADFMRIWLLLSIPLVYIFRTSFGAAAYVIGTVVWMISVSDFSFRRAEQLCFWGYLALVVPYCFWLLRRNRESRSARLLALLVAIAATIGIAATAEAVRVNIGGLALAGFFTTIYLCGMIFIKAEEARNLDIVSLYGGLGIAVVALVLSFQGTWHMSNYDSNYRITGAARAFGIGVELFFPVAAIVAAGWTYLKRGRFPYSVAAAALPLTAGLGWIVANAAPADRGVDNPYNFAAAVLLNIYTFLLGVELLSRGLRAGSVVRANFGLLVIAALALARFFDTDLSFVARGVGFIVVGAGFLIANLIFFRRRTAT